MTGLVSLTIRAECRGCDWTQTGPKAATQFESHCVNTGHVTVCTSLPTYPVKENQP